MRRGLMGFGVLFGAVAAGCGGTSSPGPVPGGSTAAIVASGQPGGSAALALVALGAASPAAFVFAPGTRFRIPGQTIVHVAISPAPQVAPSVQWSTSDAGVAGVYTAGMPTPTSATLFGATPAAGDALLVEGAGHGGALLTARVGAPYNATVTQAVYSYAQLELGCGVGDNAAVQINDDGSYTTADPLSGADLGLRAIPPSHPPAPTGAPYPTPSPTPYNPCANVPQPWLLAFGFGANGVPIVSPGDFVALRASSYDAAKAVRDSSVAPVVMGSSGGVAWLGKTRTGATYKYYAGKLEVAPPGADFAITPVPAAPSAGATTSPATNTSFVTSIDAPAGGTLFAPVRGTFSPLIVGVTTPSVGSLIDPLLRSQVVLSIQPASYVLPTVAWTATTPLTLTSTSGGVIVGATAPGMGTVTATTSTPATLSATLPVLAYPVINIGCSDQGASGFGIVFDNERSIGYTTSLATSDLWASYDGSTATCTGANATPPPGIGGGAPAAAGWTFPYGGVFFPSGDDPAQTPPSGSPRGVTFDRVTAANWNNNRTSEPYAAYLHDISPCMSYANGVGVPIANCTTMADRILLIKTQNGRYVKLFWIGRSPGSFVGLYEVSRADGTFAY